MSQYGAIILGCLGLMFFCVHYMSTLAEGEHELLKFFMSGFALVMGYITTLFVNQIAIATGLAGLETLAGNLIYWWGTAMVLVFTYFLYTVIIRFLDWRRWRKNRNPFDSTEGRDFV